MNSHGPVVGGAARLSSFWTDFKTLTMNAREWYGMDESFEDISFNVQGLKNGTDFEALHKNNKNRLWIEWSTNLKRIDPLNPTRPSKDVPYELQDGRMPSEQGVPYSYRTHDPRGCGSGSKTGPQPSAQSSSSAGGGTSSQHTQEQCECNKSTNTCHVLS